MDSQHKNFSMASLVVVLGFPPMILFQINKHLLSRSLDSLHFIFFQLIFFFAYHHLLGIPSLSTTLINYLSGKTSNQFNNKNNNNKRSVKQRLNNNKDVSIRSRQIPRNVSVNNAPIKHKYSEMTEKLLENMLELVSPENDSSWNLIYEDKETDIKIYQNLSVSDCCYKVTGTMENTPQTTFDLLADVGRRPEWDIMTDEAGIIEVIDNSTKVQYVKMKGVFPTSARDVVAIGYTKQLEDGRMIMVNKSIEHKLCPEKPGVVRVEADCAGIVVEPIIGQPDKCYVIQIADANLKGWIPKSLITLVSTKDMPASIKKSNKLLAKMPRQSVSKILSHTPFVPKMPRPPSSISISSSSSNPSSSIHHYHRKISAIGGTDGQVYLSSDESLSNDNSNRNSRSIGKKIPYTSFWKSFIENILWKSLGGSDDGGSTKRFIIAAFAYSLVLIAGIKKWRNRNAI